MRMQQRPDGVLLVVSTTYFMGAVGLVVAAFSVLPWLAAGPKAAAATAILLLVALVFIGKAERSSFAVDPHTGSVTWERRTLFRSQKKEVAFGSIGSIYLENGRDNFNRRTDAYRIVLQTSQGPVLLTQAYGGDHDAQRAAAEAISVLIGSVQTGRRVPVAE